MNLNRILFLGSVTAIILVGAFAPMESVSAGEPAVANDHTSSSYTDLSTVNSPEIPASVKFAGKVRVDRKSTRLNSSHIA